MCGVGKMMKIWGKQETNKCPRCGEWETVEHVLQCHNLDAIQRFHNLMESLDEWMREANLALGIRNMIKEALIQWKKG